MRLKVILSNNPKATGEFFFEKEEEAKIRKSKRPVSEALDIVRVRLAKDMKEAFGEEYEPVRISPVPGVALEGL